MCRSDDALYRSTVLPVVLKADQHSHDGKCVNWNEAAIRELLTIRAEAEIVRQFSEMVRGALYRDASIRYSGSVSAPIRSFSADRVSERGDRSKSDIVCILFCVIVKPHESTKAL